MVGFTGGSDSSESSRTSVYQDSDGDEERDSRSEREWCDAVLVKLHDFSGAGWRRSPERRQSPIYIQYTKAALFFREQMYKEQPPCNCAAHCLPVHGYRWPKPVPVPPIPYPGEKFFKAHPHLEPNYQNGKYRGTRVKATAPAVAHDEDALKRLRRAKRESMQLYKLMTAREDAGLDATALREAWTAKRDEVDAIAQGLGQMQEMATA